MYLPHSTTNALICQTNVHFCKIPR